MGIRLISFAKDILGAVSGWGQHFIVHIEIPPLLIGCKIL